MRNETFIIMSPEVIKPVIWPYVIAALLLMFVLWNMRFRVKAARLSSKTPVVGESVELSASICVGLTTKKSIEEVRYRVDSPDAAGVNIDIAGVPGRRTVKVNTVIDTSGLRPGSHAIFINAQRSDGKWCSPVAVRFDLMQGSDK